MTIEELERELKTLADPQPEDESLRLTIRARLAEEPRSRPRTRRRTRLVIGSVALAAATAAAAIVALIGFGGSGGPSSANAAILAHVVRSMSTPANLIVHVKETGMNPDGTPVSVEWWQETNPPYAFRLIKTIGGSAHEGANAGTTCATYDPGSNTIDRVTECKSAALIDPVQIVRAELMSGTAQVAGTTTIDGQSLYKIELPTGVVGYFDQTDYRPVYLDNPQGDGGVVRTHVLAYDELPLTSQNDKLLSLAAQHPDARVESRSALAK